MNLLIDTHIFIWFINGDKKLSQRLIDLISNIKNRCYLSIASIWEIAIKISLERLEISGGFNNIKDFIQNNYIEILPISFEHLQRLINLEFYHKDPFDRIIIAQAISEELNLITLDVCFNNYSVNIIR